MGTQRLERAFPALGTINTVTIVLPAERGCASPKDVAAATACLDDIRARVLALDDALSVFKPKSEVSRLNATAGAEAVDVSTDTYALLEEAKRYARLTGGAFDVTAGGLTRLWRHALADGVLPTVLQVRDARERCGSDAVILARDDDRRTARLARPRMGVDLGGIAKGYAARLARDMLRGRGPQCALVNFGGTVVALGREWRVGVRSPLAPVGHAGATPEGTAGTLVGTLAVRDAAVVTSGSYEQSRVVDGRLVHHIVDPATGWPAQVDLACVTLVGQDPCELDALATAAFVMDARRAAALLADRGIDAVFVTWEGDVLVTPGLQGRFSSAGAQQS